MYVIYSCGNWFINNKNLVLRYFVFMLLYSNIKFAVTRKVNDLMITYLVLRITLYDLLISYKTIRLLKYSVRNPKLDENLSGIYNKDAI